MYASTVSRFEMALDPRSCLAARSCAQGAQEREGVNTGRVEMRSFLRRSRGRQLEEVKAILHRLQSLSADFSPGVPATAAAKISSPSRTAGRRVLAAGLGLLGGLAMIGLGAYVLRDLEQSSVPAADLRAHHSSEAPWPLAGERRPEAMAQSILEKALQDLAAGRVKVAREALMRSQHQGSADMAWVLARSYDPNFLTEIARPDAEPNVREAARWYRIWYSRAVADGLVANSVSLERIIGSMADAPRDSPNAK
jgi:hypothetical protein